MAVPEDGIKVKMLNVIYEDNHLLVVEKPVNMPVQADDSGDEDLLSEAKRYIKAKYNKPGDVYLGLVHRLDRPVGGVMVFARTSKAAARLTAAIKAHAVTKKYCAIVENRVHQNGQIDNYIIKDDVSHSAHIVDGSYPGAQYASLRYALVCTKKGRYLIDIDLRTGRHHQIRVQFANLGSPLYGDQRYNPNAKPGQQIALYAYSLTLEHPTLKEKMTFCCVPKGGVWTDFSEELSALSAGVRCTYIDKNIIAVNKQAGVACTVEDGGEDTLEARLIAAFTEIYPVHRLDVPTTGLVLFARNRAAYDEMTELIHNRILKKFYRTVVFGRPPKDRDRLLLYAEKDAERSLVTVFDSPTGYSREMDTAYRVCSHKTLINEKTRSSVEATELEIELFTGRTHQIRASLSFIGCPVIGDDKYGKRELNKLFGHELMLCAVRIVFPSDMKVLSELNGKTLEIEPPFLDA